MPDSKRVSIYLTDEIKAVIRKYSLPDDSLSRSISRIIFDYDKLVNVPVLPGNPDKPDKK